ncbi:hypothetical protein pipiens_012576 [Culex pipiens pipiens]|uniref:Uncharacterized protein n=1 Tax=Culex pipiens pipiens TaxID=38569 RepID=A0ABD1D1U4_CULPP
MKEEPDLGALSPNPGGSAASQQLQRPQLGRHSRTTSATSYDSESDDNMLQSKATTPGGKDSGDDGESLGGSSSASKYDSVIEKRATLITICDKSTNQQQTG